MSERDRPPSRSGFAAPADGFRQNSEVPDFTSPRPKMQPDEPAWAEILIPGTKIAKKAAAPPVPNDEPAWSDILLGSAKAEKSLSSEEQLHAESDARRRRRVELVEKTAREKAAAKAAMRQAALTARCAIRLQALVRGSLLGHTREIGCAARLSWNLLRAFL